MNRSYTSAEKKHLERIKSMSCVVCDAHPPSAAHHVKQDSAYHCIPLCYEFHQGKGGIHQLKSMWKIMRMDEVDALAKLIERMA